MIGIDLGMNVGSVTLLSSEGAPCGRIVVKPEKYKDSWMKILKASVDYWRAVMSLQKRAPWAPNDVSIEEPVYSWGRRNPKVFANSVILMALTRRILERKGYTVTLINNQSAKRVAGTANIRGKNKKLAMILAYEQKTKKFAHYQPLTGAKKNQETLADSYFIALAGLKESPRGKVRTKKV